MLTQLAQSRPSNTSAASIYNTDRPWTVTHIVIANTTSASADASVFHDADGTTYDQTTALLYAVNIPANSSTMVELNLSNTDRLGNLAVQSDTASALTFTAYGESLGERY